MNTRSLSSVRFKIIAIIAFCIIILSLTIYNYSINIFQQSYNNIEKDKTVQNVERVRDTLDNTISQLSVRLIDWSWWDDTYIFAKDSNKSYIESNLGNSSISNIKINSIVFVNNVNEVFFRKTISLLNKEEVSSSNLDEHVRSHKKLTNIINDKVPQSGIINLPEGPMLISAASILNSDAQGPSHGTLIFGKYLDSSLVAEVSKLTHLPVTLYKYDDLFLPEDVAMAKTKILKGEKDYTSAISDNTISGYSVINDYYGDPALILRVDSTREVYTQGLKTLNKFLYIAIVATIFFGLIIYILIEIFFIYRFSVLNKEVVGISQNKDFNARVTEVGNDGMGALAFAINKMLDALSSTLKLEEENHKKIIISEQNLNDKLQELEKMNRLMVDRELKMVDLKNEIKDLKVK